MEEFVQAAQKLFGVQLAGRQVAALLAFENELLAWNQKFNLTAIRDRPSMLRKHILDSLSLQPYLRGTRIADVGTGAAGGVLAGSIVLALFIIGSVIGVLIMGVIYNGLVMLNIPSYAVEMIRGIMLILIVASYEVRARVRR